MITEQLDQTKSFVAFLNTSTQTIMQKIALALTHGPELKPPPGNVCKTSVQRCTPTLDTTKLLIK